MPVSLFTFVDLFSRSLATTSHLLTKGAAYAQEKGITEAEMLDWRLVDDMHPLRFQVTAACNLAAQWPARIVGMDLLADVDQQLTVPGFQKAIAARRAMLAAIQSHQFDGRDDAPFTFQIMPGMQPTLPSAQWLTSFATTNVFFHVSMVYAVLRARGVPLGKGDMFSAGL